MITYYKTINGRMEKLSEYEKDCWVNCIEPTETEMDRLVDELNVEPEILRAALDEEESSHIDTEDDNMLLIIDIPVVQRQEKNLSYMTLPLAFIITCDNIITVSIRDNPIIAEFEEGVVKYVSTFFKTQFILRVMERATAKYLQYLKQIDRIIQRVDQELRKSMRNKQLLQLLEIEKSLVYFSASLKSNDATMQKIKRGRLVKMYDDDRELLEDILIEMKQAIDMSAIHLNILSSSMDAFSSVISNNLNIVMKKLTSITLILSIPTIISGFYGMNNIETGAKYWGPITGLWWFPFAASGVAMAILWYILKKTNML